MAKWSQSLNHQVEERQVYKGPLVVKHSKFLPKSYNSIEISNECKQLKEQMEGIIPPWRSRCNTTLTSIFQHIMANTKICKNHVKLSLSVRLLTSNLEVPLTKMSWNHKSICRKIYMDCLKLSLHIDKKECFLL